MLITIMFVAIIAFASTLHRQWPVTSSLSAGMCAMPLEGQGRQRRALCAGFS